MKTVFTEDIKDMITRAEVVSGSLKEHANFYKAMDLQSYEGAQMLSKAVTAARNLELALAEYLKATRHLSAGVAIAPRYNSPKIRAPFLDGGFEDLAGPVF